MTTQEEIIIKEFYEEAKKEYEAALASYQKKPYSNHAKECFQEAAAKEKAIFNLCCMLNITVWSNEENS